MCNVQAGQMQCDTGLHKSAFANNATGYIPDNVPSLPLYTCREVEHPANTTPWLPHSGSITPDLPDNSTDTETHKTVYYNQMATLLQSRGCGVCGVLQGYVGFSSICLDFKKTRGGGGTREH